MKKLMTLMVFVAMLSACGGVASVTSVEDAEEKERFIYHSKRSGTGVYVDNETGCKYLFTKRGYGGGLSPLYNENGEVDCGKRK